MKLSYGWVVVGAGMLMTCIGVGAMLSLAVFLQPIAAGTGWSRSGISAAATLNFLCMGAADFLWGMMSDRFGTRIVVVLGSLLLGLGLIAASRATTLLEFQLAFGVLVGVAVGSFYAPMMAVATAWLEDRRNLAAALVSAGMGMGSMTVAPLAGWLLGAFDWRTAMLVVGAVAWVLLIPAALLVRRPPDAASADGAPVSDIGPGSGLSPDCAPGAGHATVCRHRPYSFRLLRCPLGADLPHGRLRHHVRGRPDARRQRL